MSQESFTSMGAATAEGNRGAPQSAGSPLKEKAGATADSMHTEAERIRSAAREQGAAAVEQLKSGVHSATQQARDAGQKFVVSQRDMLAQRCSSIAEAARAASQKLGEGDGNMLAGPAQTAADQLDRLGNYLRSKEPVDFFRDLESFTRKRPELVFGGLFVAGLAAARFLKASRRSLDERERSEAIIPTSGPDALEPVPHVVPSQPDIPPVSTTNPSGGPATTPPML